MGEVSRMEKGEEDVESLEKPKSLGDQNIETRERLMAASEKDARDTYRDLAEARNLFDVDEILVDALKPKKMMLSELGDNSFHVFWCPLNSVDRVKILRIEDENAAVRIDLINRMSVYIMLSKADDRFTEEIVQRMPAHWIDLILTKIVAEQGSFL